MTWSHLSLSLLALLVFMVLPLALALLAVGAERVVRKTPARGVRPNVRRAEVHHD